MKIRVGVLYGGKTTEHEVSIITAVQAMGFLNTDKYEVIPMYLTKENEMYTGAPLKEMDVYKEPELLKRYCKNVVCYNKNGALVLQNKNGLFKKTIATVDIVDYAGYTWEVDEFQGALAGLVLAEVELSDPEAEVPLPPFAGTEVTGDPAYYNSNLASRV